MKYTLKLLFILIITFSCKKAEMAAEESPISTFDSPFPKNNKQLDRIFGETLHIKNYNDILILNIKSNKDNNLITTINGDTIFFGKVCKYRDLYYFNHKVDDSSYYISAFKIKGNLIYGLDFYPQFFAVDKKILKGNYSKNVKSINSDSSKIRLQTNKSDLKKLFTSIINESIPDTILNSKSNLNNLAESKITNDTEATEENGKSDIEFDVKVYPIPAVDFIYIDTNIKSTFQLINNNNKIVLQGKLSDLKNTLDISNQKSGLYFLIVKDIKNHQTRTLKIIIE